MAAAHTPLPALAAAMTAQADTDAAAGAASNIRKSRGTSPKTETYLFALCYHMANRVTSAYRDASHIALQGLPWRDRSPRSHSPFSVTLCSNVAPRRKWGPCRGWPMRNYSSHASNDWNDAPILPWLICVQWDSSSGIAVTQRQRP